MYHYVKIDSNNFYPVESYSIIYDTTNSYLCSHIVSHRFLLLAATAAAAALANQYTHNLILIGVTYMIRHDYTDRNCHTAPQPPKQNRIICDTP